MIIFMDILFLLIVTFISIKDDNYDPKKKEIVDKTKANGNVKVLQSYNIYTNQQFIYVYIYIYIYIYMYIYTECIKKK